MSTQTKQPSGDERPGRESRSVDKRPVRTDRAPAPSSVFSQGVLKGGLLQVSGQGPQDPASGRYLHAGDVEKQTRTTLGNVRAVVEAAGGTFEDVVSLRVFLTSQENFERMNRAYGAFVREHVPSEVFPARTTVFTGLPREQMLVEIDALAVLSPDRHDGAGPPAG